MAKKRENVNQMGYEESLKLLFPLVNMHLCVIFMASKKMVCKKNVSCKKTQPHKTGQ